MDIKEYFKSKLVEMITIIWLGDSCSYLTRESRNDRGN